MVSIVSFMLFKLQERFCVESFGAHLWPRTNTGTCMTLDLSGFPFFATEMK